MLKQVSRTPAPYAALFNWRFSPQAVFKIKIHWQTDTRVLWAHALLTRVSAQIVNLTHWTHTHWQQTVNQDPLRQKNNISKKRKRLWRCTFLHDNLWAIAEIWQQHNCDYYIQFLPVDPPLPPTHCTFNLPVQHFLISTWHDVQLRLTGSSSALQVFGRVTMTLRWDGSDSLRTTSLTENVIYYFILFICIHFYIWAAAPTEFLLYWGTVNVTEKQRSWTQMQ